MLLSGFYRANKSFKPKDLLRRLLVRSSYEPELEYKTLCHNVEMREEAKRLFTRLKTLHETWKECSNCGINWLEADIRVVIV